MSDVTNGKSKRKGIVLKAYFTSYENEVFFSLGIQQYNGWWATALFKLEDIPKLLKRFGNEYHAYPMHNMLDLIHTEVNTVYDGKKLIGIIPRYSDELYDCVPCVEEYVYVNLKNRE